MSRWAALDIGTNSVLLTVVEQHGDELLPIVERATVTRLGQGVDSTKRLHPDACDRTLACLAEYRQVLDSYDVTRVAAVGTSALRDAQHGAEFRASGSVLLGCEIEVISGLREAQLSFVGALSGLESKGRTFVFDIGGGSTELVWGVTSAGSGEPTIERSTSLDLGSVRLHERFGLGDPPRAEKVERMRSFVREQLRNYLPDPRSLGALETVVGVAGTVTSLAALTLELSVYDAKLVHGASTSASELRKLAERLTALTVAERERMPSLTKGRADVIVCGAWLCFEILDWLGVDTLRASDRGVRWGLLHELARTI